MIKMGLQLFIYFFDKMITVILGDAMWDIVEIAK